jgi:hypothetical protein
VLNKKNSIATHYSSEIAADPAARLPILLIYSLRVWI